MTLHQTQLLILIIEKKGQALKPALLNTGALGFEPRDGGTKTHCLTTWLRPNEVSQLQII